MKRNIRKGILQQNRDLPIEIRDEFSDKINSQLLQLIDANETSIALFYPMDSEPNIIPLIEELLSTGKILSFPIITDKRLKSMVFSSIKSLDDLVAGEYNIYAPKENNVIEKFDVVIVPTVGSNSEFKRLGMGGGFYDRFFETYQKLDNPPKFIAPIYDENMNIDFEADNWDIVFDYVVTEKRVYKRQF